MGHAGSWYIDCPTANRILIPPRIVSTVFCQKNSRMDVSRAPVGPRQAVRTMGDDVLDAPRTALCCGE